MRGFETRPFLKLGAVSNGQILSRPPCCPHLRPPTRRFTIKFAAVGQPAKEDHSSRWRRTRIDLVNHGTPAARALETISRKPFGKTSAGHHRGPPDHSLLRHAKNALPLKQLSNQQFLIREEGFGKPVHPWNHVFPGTARALSGLNGSE